jgi:3-oxoacyl-[acyl-carrier protein] reductase
VTRAAVVSYSKTIAQELGPWGITSNTVLTGGVVTERFRSLIEKGISGSEKTYDERVQELAAGLPLRQFASPDEFAKNVLFLASDFSSYITGTAIPIDGGASKAAF